MGQLQHNRRRRPNVRGQSGRDILRDSRMALAHLRARLTGAGRGARFDPPTIALAFLGAAVVSALEEAFWSWRDQPSETATLLAATGVLCVATGALAWLLRLILGRGRALALSLAFPILVPLVHALRPGLFEARLRYHVLVAAPVALLAAIALSWLMRSRRGPVLAAAVGAFALVPTLIHPHPVRAHGTAAAGARRPPDVLFVVIDTVRRDAVSLYGSARGTTPRLDAFAAKAQVFDDAWSVAPWTPASHASMFSGMLPAEHGIDGPVLPPFPEDVPNLAALMRKAGYETAALPANPHLTGQGWSRGFRWFRPPWRRGEHTLVRLADEWISRHDDHWEMEPETPALLGRARRWWTAHEGLPRFLFVNLLDAHRPYQPPAAFLRRFLDEPAQRAAALVEQDPLAYHLGRRPSADDARLLRALYHGEVASLDDQLGAFLDWLDARGDLDRTVVVIVSDHGEHLGERGLVGHEVFLDQYLLRVPLLVRYPPGAPPGRIARRVQLDGVPGYILHLAGVPGPRSMLDASLHLQSRPLVFAQRRSPDWFFAQMRARNPSVDAVSCDRNFVSDGRFAYVASARADGRREAALVDMGADPDWTRDVSADHPAELARLREAERTLPRYQARPAGTLDEAARERLRALGYVQ